MNGDFGLLIAAIVLVSVVCFVAEVVSPMLAPEDQKPPKRVVH